MIHFLTWSYRRILLDRDLKESKKYMAGLTLDIGGGRKGGSFKEPSDATWVILDIERQLYPHILSDAQHIPVKSNAVDCVKCTELLEHVEHPEIVMDEILRILKPSGTLILSVPFNVGVHSDPYDFQRFTDLKLKRMLEDNFCIVKLKKQGLFFSVLAYMIRQAIVSCTRSIKFLLYPLLPILNLMIKLDNLSSVQNSKFMNSFTTGYFLIARKR